MDNFLKVLENAKQAELKELKKTFQKKKETVLAQLESEIDSLEQQFKNQERIAKHLETQQNKYLEMKNNDFVEMELKAEISENIFFDLVKKLLKNESTEKKWLSSGMESVEGLDKGQIRVGNSEKILKTIKTKHEVKVDKNMSEKGFVFSNQNVEIDHSENNYFKNLLDSNRAEIYKILFN